MSNDSDELGSAATRPSAPRIPPPPAVSTQGTVAMGGSGTTTLPVVTWSERGPVLQPSTLPRYETLDRLGEGGMGEVVRARDNDIGREVAVKRLRPDLQHPELSARFVEEVRTVGQLEHPNIVPIHDAGVDAQGYFFVMKHVEGESLAAIIERLRSGEVVAHARWPFERRLDVLRKVLEALRYAHSRGVIHRDIKPANILVGPMGEVFVLDWGIARRERSAPDVSGSTPPAGSAFQTRVGAVMGTPLYMSPEQARGDVVDARSDLYSLCLTMYEFMTLQQPFAGKQNTAQVMQAVLTQKIPLASFTRHAHQPQVPMDLTWLLAKGVAKEPSARYQTAEELLHRLDDRAEGNVPIQCHVTATKRLSYEALRLVNRFPLLWAGVVLGCVGAGAYVLLR